MSCVLNNPTMSDMLVVHYTTEPETGQITMSGLQPDGVERIGTFRNAAEAWAALDAYDSPRG
jgi:hypothetical protein